MAESKIETSGVWHSVVAVGRLELVLGDNGLSKGSNSPKCTTDHYEGFATELHHQTFEKEQIARFPRLFYQTLILLEKNCKTAL